MAIGARRIERSAAPLLYDKMEEICSKAGTLYPEILVIPGSRIDVYSASAGGNKNTIVFTSKALDMIDERDMEAVLRGELFRVRGRGGSLRKIPNYMLIAISRLPDMVAAAYLQRKGARIRDSIVGDGYHIRAATEEDLMAMFRYCQSAFGEHNVSLHELRRMALGNNSITQVVERDGKPIGFLAGRVKLNRSGMYGRGDVTVIDEKHRRHGLSRLMLLALIQAFKEAGCKYVISEIMTDNVNSIRMTESIGFRKIGIKKDFYSVGVDAIIVKKSLE